MPQFSVPNPPRAAQSGASQQQGSQRPQGTGRPEGLRRNPHCAGAPTPPQTQPFELPRDRRQAIPRKAETLHAHSPREALGFPVPKGGHSTVVQQARWDLLKEGGNGIFRNMADIGRPSSFTDEIAQQICERLSGGETLIQICDSDGMPSGTTVYRWLQANSSFREIYARAREEQADYFAEDIMRIADTDPDSSRSRVRVDARKWFASKVAPRKYGDKIAMTGADGGPIQVEAVRFGEGDGK